MKKYLVLIILGTILASGCKTEQPLVIATKTSGTVVVTVDAGMYAWKSYVEHNVVAGDKIDKVAQAYNAYYVAALADKAALEQAVNTTNSVDIVAINQSLSTAENSLLALLNSYLTPIK